MDFRRDVSTAERFRATLSNRYQVPQDWHEHDGGLNINSQKEAVNYACEEVVSRRKPEQKEWLSAETYRKIQERKFKKAAINNGRTRVAKKEAQNQYAEANSEEKRNIKTDKRNFVDRVAQETDEAAASGNMKQLYDIIKKLTGKFGRTERPAKDKNGSVLMGADKQLSRWADYFEKLLDRPAPANKKQTSPQQKKTYQLIVASPPKKKSGGPSNSLRMAKHACSRDRCDSSGSTQGRPWGPTHRC